MSGARTLRSKLGLGLCLVALPAIASAQAPQVIDLPTALRLAGGKSLDVDLAKEKLIEAQAVESTVRSRFFPWISPSLGYRRHDGAIQDVVGNILDASKYSYAPTLGFQAQLDLGDTLYQSRAAKDSSAAASFSLSASVQDAVLRAALAYFDLSSEQSFVEVARESVRIAADYEGELKQAVAIGIATELEALRSRVQRQRNELQLEQALSRQRLASVRLASALRLSPATPLAAADAGISAVALVPADATLPGLIELALNANPEIRQSRSLVDAAEALKEGTVRGPLIPTLAAQISLGGLGGGRAGIDSKFGGAQDYAATIQWRIGPGGLFDGNRKALAEARVRIASLGFEVRRQDLERQVAEAFTQVASLAEQVRIAEQAMTLAQESLRMSRERKDFQVAAVLETLFSEQELTRARYDYLRAVADHNKAQYTLARRLGNLSPTEPIPPTRLSR